jgi:hypothetical protein
MKSFSARWSALVAALPLIVLGLAPAAPASAQSPTGDYAVFSNCPLEVPAVSLCLAVQMRSGQVTAGKLTLPIDRTLTIQGGLAEGENGQLGFVPAAGGQSFPPVPLAVPGGLFSVVSRREVTRWANKGFARWYQSVEALTGTLEVVGPPQVSILNIIFQEGPAMVLPLRIKLGNTLLGPACYIGSPAEPITLALTDGTTSPPPPNTPISGTPGSLSIRDEGSLLELAGSSLVDNAYAVPRANGCGPGGLLTGAIDNQLGLPAPAGTNTAIMDGSSTLAVAEAVRASESS